MAVYSHSRLNSFDQCPRKFLWRYVWNAQPEAEGIEAFLGKRVHESLEALYRQVTAGGPAPPLADLLRAFDRRWDETYGEGVRIVAALSPDEYRRAGADCLSTYHGKHYPFAAGTTVGIERGFEFALDPAGAVRLRGFIDRIDVAADGALEVHDYKTGNRAPTAAALAGDPQVGIYEMAAREMFPGHRQIRLIWHYLRSGVERRLPARAPAALVALRRDTHRRIRSIEAQIEAYLGTLETNALLALRRSGEQTPAHVPEPAREPSQGFPARPGPLCRWCSYVDWCRDGAEHLGVKFDPPPPPPAGKRAEVAGQGRLF